MNRATRYSPEIRERAVRMVFEHQAEYDSQWAAMNSIASKIGCRVYLLFHPIQIPQAIFGLRETRSESEFLCFLFGMARYRVFQE